MKSESNVPKKLNSSHVGKRVIFHKSEFSTLLCEGEVKELSPQGEYVNVSGRWVEKNNKRTGIC